VTPASRLLNAAIIADDGQLARRRSMPNAVLDLIVGMRFVDGKDDVDTLVIELRRRIPWSMGRIKDYRDLCLLSRMSSSQQL
jgi:hypothetical protein